MIDIRHGDCRELLRAMPSASVQCCVTSPPYFRLRDYGMPGQIGAETSPNAYVAELVSVFREARRVLADDGTLWLNMGDSYAGSWGAYGRGAGTKAPRPDLVARHGTAAPARSSFSREGIKPKDLFMMPARVALALQEDGWWLRSDIIWHKPNPMPESIRDRPTSAHEHVFLLTKSRRYFYDAVASREAITSDRSPSRKAKVSGVGKNGSGRVGPAYDGSGDTRNSRNVWTITPNPFRGAHFATMPPALAERCILAGTRSSDTVLDPFAGAGTTGLVANRLGRSAILLELNPSYASLAHDRIERARAA